MASPLERRHTGGRRQSDSRDTQALRGLLHDLGHELSTLSVLVEAVRGNPELPQDASFRMELLAKEMARLLDIIRQGLQGSGDAPRGPVDVREVAAELTRLAQLTYDADVVLLPGPAAAAVIHPLLLWRLLSNVVDNAARAAGAGGRVTVAVRGGGRPAGGTGRSPSRASTVIEVTDDGPGFGSAPGGQASLGLGVVTAVLAGCGGSLEVTPAPAGGTTVLMRLPVESVVPEQAAAHAGR